MSWKKCPLPPHDIKISNNIYIFFIFCGLWPNKKIIRVEKCFIFTPVMTALSWTKRTYYLLACIFS